MKKTISILSTKKLKPVLKNKAAINRIAIADYQFIETNQLINTSVARQIEKPTNCWVFTSKEAVNAVLQNINTYKLELPAKLLICCLQGATLNAVKKTGWKVLLTATSAKQLAQMICLKDIEAVQFFCSNIRRYDLPDIITTNGKKIKEVIVYETKLLPVIIQHNYEAVLFFSPSAVQSFFTANRLAVSIPCFCIGATTATALQQYTNANKIFIAETPSQQNVLQQVEAYFTKTNKNKNNDNRKDVVKRKANYTNK